MGLHLKVLRTENQVQGVLDIYDYFYHFNPQYLLDIVKEYMTVSALLQIFDSFLTYLVLSTFRLSRMEASLPPPSLWADRLHCSRN